MWNLKKKKKKLIDREQVCSCQRWGGGQMREGGQKVQSSNYKINKSWKCNVQHGDSNNIVLHI